LGGLSLKSAFAVVSQARFSINKQLETSIKDILAKEEKAFGRMWVEERGFHHLQTSTAC